MEVLRAIRSVLGWLTGSLAGIAAVCYGAGYLVMRAKLRMLGLLDVYEHDHDRYLQEGSLFFYSVAYSAVRNWLGVVLVLSIVAGIVAAVVGLLLVWSGRRPHLRSLRGSPTIHVAMYGIASALFMASVQPYADEFRCPLRVSNVLHGTATETGRIENPQTCNSAGLSRAIREGNHTALRGSFDRLVNALLFGLVLLSVIWGATLGWRARGLFVAPFVFMIVSTLVLLPMDYGVLVRPSTYPRWRPTSTIEPGISRRWLYLLKETGAAFVLWDPCQLRVQWLAKDNVNAAEIGPRHALFDRKVHRCNEP